ncbi:hypothetical protein D0N36_02765 [Hymenobacter lapidiphilus]|uniref:hypothetical protein n=1 Tax=Hymenobacter sp. CCM 8763 TaxID=2303334 RepID=UPI000E3504B4|nr:hypothetical protein [Hymenobacter sp. CCM 8763]RFP66641.1 hypothetical protein D0N36_02765 [Hymenobacter sp. CCM 8763]
MKKDTAPEMGQTILLPPACAALRNLYRTARHLPSADPYTPARLARIADQAEYLLDSWPAAQWPGALHSGQPLPARAVLLAWVATARRDIAHAGTAAGTSWPYPQWHRITTTLLAALVPFA